MLTYELVDINGDELIYRYYPEGKKAPGVVVFKTDGTRARFDDSTEDPHGIYRYMAFSGIEVGKEKGMVAWG